MKPLRETITLLGLLVPAVYIAITWSSLPALIPSHFGLSGEPDRFAARGVLWFILGISAVLYALLAVVERFPRLFNLSGPRTGAGRIRAEQLGKDLISWIRLEIVLTFAYLIWAIISIAHQRMHGLGANFTLFSLLVVTITLIYYLVRIQRLPTTQQ